MHIQNLSQVILCVRTYAWMHKDRWCLLIDATHAADRCASPYAYVLTPYMHMSLCIYHEQSWNLSSCIYVMRTYAYIRNRSLHKDDITFAWGRLYPKHLSAPCIYQRPDRCDANVLLFRRTDVWLVCRWSSVSLFQLTDVWLFCRWSSVSLWVLQ